MKRRILLIAKVFVFLIAFLSTTLLYCQDGSYAISGTLVTARGTVNDGIILISHGAIEGIGSKIPVPKGTPVIETGGVIFPGLIDLHKLRYSPPYLSLSQPFKRGHQRLTY